AGRTRARRPRRARRRPTAGRPRGTLSMCGIVGYVGPREAVPVIIEDRRRSVGKLCNLEDSLKAEPLAGAFGLGHTRWATHGRPSEENAHPHQDCTGKIVVVHNGIIENYLHLNTRLAKAGHRFVT